MRTIIEMIYNYILECGDDYFKRQHISNEEGHAYDAIRDTLTEKQKEAFDKFEELYTERQCKSEEEMFFVGFRMGAKVVFEIMGLDFSPMIK